MSMSRNQVIQRIIEALPQASAEQLGIIYNLVVSDDPIIAIGKEHYEHQDMVD